MNNKIKFAFIASLLSLGFSSCQDEWDDHYGQVADTPMGTASLYEVLSSRPELSDFCKVLDQAKVFSNCRLTNVTYADLLGHDQFFTVWAPVNGTFNCDSLLQMCKTSEGDSLVELHFLKNHIARYSHPVNGKEESVFMFNGKAIHQDATSFNGIDIKESNIATRNGIVHVLAAPVPYYHNIYESLIGLKQYDHIGKFLRTYQVDKLNEAASLAKGVVDGKTVYIDSVFYSYNSLLVEGMYGEIDMEDSTYWMLVPDRELWDSLYAEAETYFIYDSNSVTKADSMHLRFSHYALMQDLVYNPNKQYNINKYITSTPWTNQVSSTEDLDEVYSHHYYVYPFRQGGLFHQDTWRAVQQCSNGKIYNLSKWPFTKEELYFYPLRYDIEKHNMTFDEGVKTKKITVDIKTADDSRVHNQYVSVTPATQTDPYYVEFDVPDVLSGTYDIYVTFLPRNIDPTLPFTDETTAGKRNRRSAKFTAEISYMGTDGKSHTVDSRTRYVIDETNPAYYVKGSTSDKFLFECNLNASTAGSRAFINDPFELDSVKLCTMHFPTCSYALSNPTVRVKIKNAITNQETNKYWGVWFIDRVIFMPHKEE